MGTLKYVAGQENIICLKRKKIQFQTQMIKYKFKNSIYVKKLCDNSKAFWSFHKFYRRFHRQATSITLQTISLIISAFKLQKKTLLKNRYLLMLLYTIKHQNKKIFMSSNCWISVERFKAERQRSIKENVWKSVKVCITI